MGKDLKGKELGKGICQRKDGLYFARRVAQGKKYESYFKTVKESDPVLGPYVLASVTEGLTFVELKSMYDIPCERDMFYDRRRKFFWVLNGVR